MYHNTSQLKRFKKLDVDWNNLDRRMDLSQEQLRSEKRRIMKNVIVISFAFLLLFTAFQSMAALQSSINKVRKSPFRFCPATMEHDASVHVLL